MTDECSVLATSYQAWTLWIWADPDVLAAARSFLEQFASPGAPAGPDVPFGPSRPVAGDAPALDQVLALAGRDLTWTAA